MSENKVDLLKDFVDISRELQRVYSYLLNGQVIHAHRHSCRLQGSLGKNSEPSIALNSLIRNLHEGKQVQAEADVKRLGEMLKAAHEEVCEELKKTTGAGDPEVIDSAPESS